VRCVVGKRSHGEGTVFYSEPQKRWVAEITLPEGRRRKYGKTQREVKEWLLAQREALRDGLIIKDAKMTVEQFFTRWLDDVVRHSVKTKTYQSYKSLVELHVIPVLGSTKLSALRPDHLQALYAQKLKDGLSKRTVQYVHAVVRRGLKQAVRWGLLVRNIRV
jgi:integrase